MRTKVKTVWHWKNIGKAMLALLAAGVIMSILPLPEGIGSLAIPPPWSKLPIDGQKPSLSSSSRLGRYGALFFYRSG